MSAVNNNIASPPASAGDFVKGKPCLCFKSSDPIHEVIEMMRKNHTYAVAVIEHGKLAGLLTGQDILIHAASCRMQCAPSMESVAKAFNVMKASDVMIRNPVTVHKETPLDEVMLIMKGNGFRYIPVVSDDYPVGILSILDVMKYMEEKARRDSATKDEILSYVMSHENYGCVSKD